MYLMSVWWRGGYGRVNVGTRVSDMAAENREAAPRNGVR
jgi:hypothetical protein